MAFGDTWLGKKFQDKMFLKGISTVIGAVLVNWICGSIFPLTTLCVYQISYIKHEVPDSSISVDNLMFYYPFEIFFQCLSAFFCGIIEKKLGLHKTNLIGFSLLAISYFILFLSKSFGLDVVSMIVGGIGEGIIYYPSTRNACFWFPDHNGVIMGIIETMISIGSFCFSLMGESVINPDAKESGEDEIYEWDVAKNTKTYFLICIALIVSVYIISFFMMFEKKGNEETGDKDKNSDQKNFRQMYKTVLKSKRFLTFMALSVCYHQGPAMLFSLYRIIGEYENVDQNILQWINSTSFIFECLSGIIVGVICDYVRLNIVLAVITSLMIAFIYTYCFSYSNSWAFFFSNNLSTFVNGGIYPFEDCFMFKVFGSDIYIELMGINTCISNTVVLALSPISYYIETSVEEKGRAFWILFSIFGTFNLIAFLLGFFVKTDPFNYEERMISSLTEKPALELTNKTPMLE